MQGEGQGVERAVHRGADRLARRLGPVQIGVDARAVVIADTVAVARRLVKVPGSHQARARFVQRRVHRAADGVLAAGRVPDAYFGQIAVQFVEGAAVARIGADVEGFAVGVRGGTGAAAGFESAVDVDVVLPPALPGNGDVRPDAGGHDGGGIDHAIGARPVANLAVAQAQVVAGGVIFAQDGVAIVVAGQPHPRFQRVGAGAVEGDGGIVGNFHVIAGAVEVEGAAHRGRRGGVRRGRGSVGGR